MANASGESENPPRASATAVPLPSPPDKPLTTQGLVLRNAMLLMVAQAIATPLAILTNAVLARFLGPVDFGYIYLAGTFLAFGFLAVEWGQAGMLPALISRDRGSASVVLGTALSWRLGMAPIAYLIITATCWALGYGGDLQIVLALAFMGAVVLTLNGACQDAVRGFERTDVAATTQVMSSLLGVVVLVPVLLMGGGVRSVLAAQAACALVILCVLWRALRSIGVNKLSFQRETLKVLLVGGTPFLAFSVAMVLQPSIDAAFLSRQASPEAVGWYAASRKLIGPLAMPASALITALYPTLTRLFSEDRQAFNRTTRDAVRTSTVLAMPIALGCLLYPDLGVRIFSRDSYGPAADNLRILSVFLLLLYFSMPLGACLAAAGRSKAWAAAQGLCVVVSLVLDPVLVPRFQAWNGNGGLGVCVATVTSEVLMVGAALFLIPAGILDRTLLKTIGSAGLSGGAMAALAYLLSGVTQFVAAPLAVSAYLGCLLLTGGLDREQIATFRGILARKTRRR